MSADDAWKDLDDSDGEMRGLKPHGVYIENLGDNYEVVTPTNIVRGGDERHPKSLRFRIDALGSSSRGFRARGVFADVADAANAAPQPEERSSKEPPAGNASSTDISPRSPNAPLLPRAHRARRTEKDLDVV